MGIICVDDHPVMLQGPTQSIQKILPDATVCGFQSAEDALSYLTENSCEILICEIELSGTDGLTLVQKAKTLYPTVNIIFHTVCDEKEHAR